MRPDKEVAPSADIVEREVPHHRRKPGRKRWIFRLTCLTLPPNPAPWQKLHEKRDQRYHDEKGARQALEAWEKGQGTYGQVYRPPYWKGEVIPPTDKSL